MIWVFVAGWFTAGVMGTAAAATVDAELRRALWHALVAFALGPAVLVMAALRRGPSMRQVSPAALGRWTRQVGSDMRPAWMLSYGGRGVLLVRRRPAGYISWRNNLPNRTADAAKK